MIGLRVSDLLVLLVVFGGVAAVAFAVILNKESSNKPQPHSSIRTSKCLPRSRFRRFSRRRPRSTMLSQLSLLISVPSAGQSWRQMPPSAKTVALLSTISDFSGAGIK